ncbi:hypothetical protein EOPP23_11445 [Endozoicomonas sp. OPT23]|uniref:hypothetical protein n=1 Tax=Endozoicomonas sp. OPT23 TaxID=2072845 RepID=UPI00129A7AEA|nr:hypothetical protein [Endozoicomonas sp. OPT23]MRI33601.1 hypothetical protein [Endozoicomonas sp. OPT23]
MIQLLYKFPDLKAAQKFNDVAEAAGITHDHLHIAHKDHLGTQKRHLNDLSFLEEFDTLHSSERGFLIGIILSVMTGFAIYEFLEGHPVASMITLFACLIVLGYSTWLGGLIGSSSDNYRLQPFHDHLEQGGALVIVDLDVESEQLLKKALVREMPSVVPAGRSSTIDNPFAGQLMLRKHF